MEVSTNYTRVRLIADEIEAELRRLGRWQDTPLPEEKFENMGAFGSNTMTFEQWIQSILLVNIRAIIAAHDDFPDESQVGVYGVRVFDADPAARQLNQLLMELDDLINNRDRPNMDDLRAGRPQLASSSDLPVPAVLYQLAEVLPTFEGDALEAQLQTFDGFLVKGDIVGREEISRMLFNAASNATPAAKRLRIIKAAKSIAAGGNAAAPYDHDEAMRKYREEFKKGYPDAGG
jgi:uncharacterized protein YqcC (DUF446 family)